MLFSYYGKFYGQPRGNFPLFVYQSGSRAKQSSLGQVLKAFSLILNTDLMILSVHPLLLNVIIFVTCNRAQW